MEVKAKLSNLRISPRKVRLVVNLIRKKKIDEAQRILNFTVKKAARPLLKLLNSATANARNNFQLDPNNLYISKITVNEGPKYKRWRARARGQVYEIQKKTSHITLVLEEISPSKKIKKKKVRKPEEIKKKTIKEEEKIEKPEEKIEKVEKPPKEAAKAAPTGRAKFKPEVETEKPKPKIVRGIKRIFRRKAF